MLTPYEGVKLRAVGVKVIVEPEPEPETAIALVKNQPDSFRLGRVVSIGSEAATHLPDLRVGERVLYAQSVACTTAVKGQHVVHWEHVIAPVVEGPIDIEARSLARAQA